MATSQASDNAALQTLWEDNSTEIKTMHSGKQPITVIQMKPVQNMQTIKSQDFFSDTNTNNSARVIPEGGFSKVQIVSARTSASNVRSVPIRTIPGNVTKKVITTVPSGSNTSASSGIQIQHKLLTAVTSLPNASGASPVTVKSTKITQPHEPTLGSWGPRVRKRSIDTPAVPIMEETEHVKRSRRSEKGNKGLRHFSMKVCEKVEQKGTTSYNEVADELVAEFAPANTLTNTDQKNIRRRVYDALNVLMAMNIIEKQKKEIKWRGLPTSSAQECQNLQMEKTKRQERIRHRLVEFRELLLQQIAFKNLVERNKKFKEQHRNLPKNSVIQLPFIIVSTGKKTLIDCNISTDKQEYLFSFDQSFQIHDDIEVLKRMSLAFGLENGQCSAADLQKAVSLVSSNLEPYVRALTRPNGLEETLVNQSRQGVSNPSVPTLSQIHFTPVDSPEGISDDEEDEDDDDSSRSSPIDV